MKKLSMLLLVLGIGLPATVSASLLLQEDFDFTGNLTSNGWTAHSGSGINPIVASSPGLIYTGYPSSGIGNAASVANFGEDDNRTFTTQSSGAAYYGFMLSSSSPALGYFAHLMQTSATFAARVFAQPANGGMNLGISNASAAPVFAATVYALNTAHLVVVKFDFATGYAAIWVNPAIGGAEPSPDQTSATPIVGFSAVGVALRQYTVTQNFIVDGIRVGSTWYDVVGGAPAAGACCAADGSCNELTAADCLATGGIYVGDGTGCSPNPCPQLGTCCAVDGTCTFVLQADCTEAWSEGGGCVPNPCTQPLGACCALDGTCSLTVQIDCTSPSAWNGSWTACSPNPCPQPGACCAEEGACTITFETACQSPSVWNPQWTSCAPNPCPQPQPGACCSPLGVCTVTLPSACLSPLTWNGAASCEANPCGFALPQVTNVVAVQRSGTTFVDVTYDLYDADGHVMTVALYISSDGLSFPIHCLTVSGDVGAGIMSGTGRQIVWDAGVDYPGQLGDTYVAKVTASDGLGYDGMAWIPAGDVRLGQTGIALPVHDFYPQGFFIDVFEVSNARYKAFIDTGGYTTEGYWNPVGWAWRVATGVTLPYGWNSNVYHGGGIAGNEPFPVIGVSWWEADAYCRWVGGRLPTEAEWEKAAKGGCEIHGDPGQCDASDTPTYPWGEGISGPRANYHTSGDPYENNGWTTPVRYYDGTNHSGYQTINSPSPYGLYDVAGNALEWCSTKYAPYPYDPDDGRENPPASYDEQARVIRGGGYWSGNVSFLRCAYRSYISPSDRINRIGFRCARND